MIDITEYAGWVNLYANNEHYEVLLGAFQAKARSMGFEFVEGTAIVPLLVEEKDALGFAVLFARFADLAPRAPMSKVAGWTNARVEDGDGEAWVRLILNGLSKRGIAMIRTEVRTIHEAQPNLVNLDGHSQLPTDLLINLKPE